MAQISLLQAQPTPSDWDVPTLRALSPTSEGRGVPAGASPVAMPGRTHDLKWWDFSVKNTG